ncbi:hypothetical protein [Thermococcus sp.]|uniref:hypothetical protein n=1 Tax=Thermococcus sp. TaxID=35749 RepID=UPI002603BF18|nr:hypothetical protein [Thermococcus sp.]
MRRLLALFIVLICTAGLASAEQVIYLNFDSYTINSDTTNPNITLNGTTVIYSKLLSLPAPKYLAGFYLHIYWYDSASASTYSATIDVYVDGKKVFTGSATTNPSSAGYYTVSVPLSGFYNTTYNIKVEMTSRDTIEVREVTFATFLTGAPYSVNSTLISLKYYPPGAADSPEGLILNHTEVLLNKTSLAEGALKFYLKWDGKTPLAILKNGNKTVLGINTDGYLFVNSTSSSYILQGAPIPIGTYVQIAVGWKSGYGYIIMNSTILKLNWNGNFSFDRIGDVNQETGSIIDEFLLYNSFVSEDYIFQLQGQESFSIKIGDHIVNVYPDGGTHLPVPLTINYYSQNGSLLNSTTWYGSDEIYTAPNGTYKIILSASGASSIYLIRTLQGSIAFLSNDASGTIEPIYVVPSEPGVLVVKNAQGQIIYADELKSSNDVIGVLGGSYYVSFTDENNITRAAGWFTFTGKGLTLILSSKLQNTTGKYADAWVENGTLKVEFVNTALNGTWNLTITYFSGDKQISSFSTMENSQKYIGAFIPPEGADTALVVVKAPNFEKKWTVYLGEQNVQTVPDFVFPWWLLMGILGIGGLLIAPARYKFLSPLVATAILGFAELAKLFTTPAWLLGSLMGISIISLIIYRPSSRVG